MLPSPELAATQARRQGRRQEQRRARTRDTVECTGIAVFGRWLPVGSRPKETAAMNSRQRKRVERRLAAILAADVAGYCG
jgi:hypothetical protein